MEENSQQPLLKRHDFQTSADLERVTDYAEEKEISAKDLENVSLCNVSLNVSFCGVCVSSLITLVEM